MGPGKACMNLSAILASPFFSICIPPALAVLQFLVMSLLLTTGFPEVPPEQKTHAGLLICALFSLCFPALIGMGWGFRQVFYSENKILSALGGAFNGLYFLGFVLFFICVFITNASN